MELDDDLTNLLEDLDEWANMRTQHIEQELEKQDVTPQFLSPHDFWKLQAPSNPHLENGLEEKDGFEEHDEDEQENNPQFEVLKSRLQACDSLLGHINHALGDLDLIETQHKLVSDKTHSLHDVCKRLLAEQTRLDRVVAGIQSPMTYFLSYDDIAPRLGIKVEGGTSTTTPIRASHPDDAQFKKDLVRLDECVTFLEGHPHYHDYQAYLKKFKNLQTQALVMIKNWVIEEIVKLSDSTQAHRAKVASTNNKQQPTVRSSFLDDSFLYSRFAEKGKLLRPSIIELEKRPLLSSTILRDALSKLCSLRYRLLSSLVINSTEVQAKDSPLVSKIMIGSEFLARVCAAEHALVSNFFSLNIARNIFVSQLRRNASNQSMGNPDDSMMDDDESSFMMDDDVNNNTLNNAGDDNNNNEVNPFVEVMESLCSCLYDSVRPIVVKESDLDKLCDASSAIESAIQDLDTRMDRDAAEPLERVLTRIAFDVQERIVFCAMLIVREDVVGYNPDNATLEAQVTVLNQKQDGIDRGGWYPPLELTLSTLIKVYRSLESSVFEQMASEAVSSCTKALCDAAKKIAKRTGQEEADLFLIKHLLILREQITPFRALSSKETRLDFGSTSRAIQQIFSRSNPKRGDLLNLIRFATPTVQEKDVDTRKELDIELKHCSEAFILRVSKKSLGPLLEFVDASQAYLQQETSTWDGLTQRDFASKENVMQAVKFCEDNTLKQIAAAREKAALFVTNAQTRSVLFNAVETNAFKVIHSASKFALDMFRDDNDLNDRLRILVRQVGSLKTAPSLQSLLPSSPTPTQYPSSPTPSQVPPSPILTTPSQPKDNDIMIQTPKDATSVIGVEKETT